MEASGRAILGPPQANAAIKVRRGSSDDIAYRFAHVIRSFDTCSEHMLGNYV